MPALNFQARFAPLVESGAKRQTIRAMRKRPIRVGDTLYLYTGMRRPGARLLRVETCTEVRAIEFRNTAIRPEIKVDGASHSWNGLYLDSIARADGFSGALEMLGWFERVHGFPFRGQLIRW